MSQPDPETGLPPLSLLCEAAREAGALALSYFGKDPKRWLKPGDSPVTEADLAIDHLLHKELRAAYPNYGWLSEEIENDGSRLNGEPTFVVDPIDGTRGFIAGNDQWLVSIAIVQDGVPKLGALFNPVRGEMYFAQTGKGAFKESAKGEVVALDPGTPKEINEANIAFYGNLQSADGKPFPFKKAGHIASLALRIAEVAEGKLDGCIAKAGAKHWDIAAADLIAREAGVPLAYRDGPLMRYDQEAISHPIFLCASPTLRGQLAELI